MTCACIAAAVLAGCDAVHRENAAQGDEMHWARAALDRNAALSVLAEDDAAKVFTVKVIASGDVRVVPLAQLVAGPAAAGTEQVPGVQAERSGAPQGQAPRAGASEAAPTQTPEAEASQGRALEAHGPGVAAPGSSAPSTPAPEPGAGRVLASGPGYSIVAAGPPGRSAGSAAAGQSGARQPAGGGAAQAQRTAEARREPMICQGNRRLRIDGQNLEFAGDAITAESGCDLHITNSRIHATGVAVSARAANVHIENSIVEGADSIDASQGSQIYLQTSTFKGVSRRLDSSQLHDLGGNVWN